MAETRGYPAAHGVDHQVKGIVFESRVVDRIVHPASRMRHQVFPAQGVGFGYNQPHAAISPQQQCGQKSHGTAADQPAC